MTNNIVLFMAFRYALGRKTYAVSLVVDEIIDRWETLDDVDKKQYKKEIQEAIDSGHAGMNIDIIEWKRILELCD